MKSGTVCQTRKGNDRTTLHGHAQQQEVVVPDEPDDGSA